MQMSNYVFWMTTKNYCVCYAFHLLLDDDDVMLHCFAKFFVDACQNPVICEQVHAIVCNHTNVIYMLTGRFDLSGSMVSYFTFTVLHVDVTVHYFAQ